MSTHSEILIPVSGEDARPTRGTPSKIRVALFGFGVVGSGVWEVLRAKRKEFRKQFGIEIEIAGICVRDLAKQRLGNVPPELLTDQIEPLLADDSIDVVLELIGGRYEAASLIEQALRGRKHVITANKLVLAHELPRLAAIAERNGVELLYSASVCGSVPVISALDELRTRDTITKIAGIVNGSTNFILTMMSDSLVQGQGVSFEEAVDEADVVADEDADQEHDREGREYSPALARISDHFPEGVGQRSWDHKDQEHRQQVAEWGRILKRMRRVGIEEASPVSAQLFDGFLRSYRSLRDDLLRAFDCRYLGVRLEILHDALRDV